MDNNKFVWGSSGSSSSSRKGKRDKQRQPQRGLGVAQLEKIRIQSEMAEYQLPNSIQSPFSNLNMSDARATASVSVPPSSIFPSQPNATIPFERRDAFYSQPQSTSPIVRPLLSGPSNIYPPNSISPQLGVTLPLFEGDHENYMQCPDSRWSTDRNSQNSDSSDTQDLDLELKL